MLASFLNQILIISSLRHIFTVSKRTKPVSRCSFVFFQSLTSQHCWRDYEGHKESERLSELNIFSVVVLSFLPYIRSFFTCVIHRMSHLSSVSLC